LLSGQTQTLDKNFERTFDNKLRLATLAEMVNAATSSYRLPSGALEKAVTRQAFEQTIRHTSVERVEQSPAFTISAGGLTTGPTAKVLVFSFPTDLGDTMPTVIIPTIAGSYMRDLFRFEGVGVHHDRSNNTCVASGFACGLNPKLSAVFNSPQCIKVETTSTDTLFFVSSAQCFPDSPGPHFYLAGRIVECPTAFCDTKWGFMDIVEAAKPVGGDDPAYLLFQTQRHAALRAVVLDEHSRGTYTTAAGHQIVFGLHEPTELSPSEEEATVVSIDGQPPPEWKTSGGLIEADGAGKATIKGFPKSEKIDFSDPTHPKVTFE
jgi:hypothetical protein